MRGDLILKLTNYAREAKRQIEAIFQDPRTERQRGCLDTIIIPSRVLSG
jgi:hypothetical protein